MLRRDFLRFGVVSGVLVLRLGFISLVFVAGCADKHKEKKDDVDVMIKAQDDRRKAEAAKRLHEEGDRFQKARVIVRTVAPGDSYADFYRKASEARLILEDATETPAGRAERYKFYDNPGAFFTVVVKGEKVVEVRREGFQK